MDLDVPTPRKSLSGASTFTIPPALAAQTSSSTSATSPINRILNASTRRSKATKSSIGLHYAGGRPRGFTGNKHMHFHMKNGRKLHIYDREKAPYPMAYNRSFLELEALNNSFLKQLCHGSVSFVRYAAPQQQVDPDLLEHPETCLDLGCGLGTWVVDAAKEWPNCHFTGFDLVNLQLPTFLLEDEIAERINWVHGNFLTTKLPFEDDEFDHIHIQGIAKGVPENKWPYLFEEVNRILRPGGAIEVIDEDVLFPVSQNFFSALRPKALTSPSSSDLKPTPLNLPDPLSLGHHSPSNSISHSSESHGTPLPDDFHDHALLESLYIATFEQRFINTTPTAMLPSYFTTYFRRVNMGPVLSFFMPPLPPSKPKAPTSGAATTIIDVLGLTSPISPPAFSEPLTSANSLSRSFSGNSGSPTDTEGDSPTPLGDISSERQRASSDASMKSIAQVMSRTEEIPPVPPLPGTSPAKDSSIPTPLPPPPQEEFNEIPKHFRPYVLETDDLCRTASDQFLDTNVLDGIHPRALCMHLYYTYTSILACSEAMWEELKNRLINRPRQLTEQFGWLIEDEENDGTYRRSRRKFDSLLNRFRSDMERRAAFWAEQCEDFGWDYPAQDDLNKAEEYEDKRFRRAMSTIRREAMDPEASLEAPCRNIRVLVGFKD
ncbi:hypothetical protein DL96DRAFT_1702477 [Flagelloscypha sp. PMI_526]|nr:hypothetical protein DL96DRAFT_1702477 [Flagelloscypha sp. PMI_526]